MSIKTPEQLKQLFEERKQINANKKQREKDKYKKAQEAIKKSLTRKYKAEHKQTQNNPIQSPKFQKITIYHSNQFVKEPDEYDLYQSWEELKDAETNPDEQGKINWDKLQELITRTKLKINEKKTGKNI